MDEKECIKTCSEIYKLSQQAAQTLKNQGIGSDFVINNLKQQLCTATERLSIAVESLTLRADKVCETGCRFGDDDCTPENCIIRQWKDDARQALAKIEEVK